MSRTSRNLCFLLVVTMVNVAVYITMSGSHTLFKSTKPAAKSNKNMIRLATRDHYEDRMSRLVKEAIRDHGLSRQNLTEMLERAMKEQVASADTRPGTNSPQDLYVHRGKTDPVNRTTSLVDMSVQSEKGNFKQERNPIEDVVFDVREIMNPHQPTEKTQDPPPKPPDGKKDGILGHIGNLFTGGKDKKTAVVFPHDYNLVLNEPFKCKNEDGSDKPVYFLVLVMSIHKNFDQRNAIRRTWGSVKDVEGKPVVTLFLLAKNTDAKHQQLVEQESQQYHDILMEDFIDTYKNLTLKTMMAMKWASIFCPHANFVMKTDDDMYVGYTNLIKHLAKPVTPTKNYVTGYVINGGPIRDPKSKWYMPHETYPGNRYPPFCSGTGYVVSGDMPAKIYQTSLFTPFLYLEDVYVAVCLNTLHVVPVPHKEFNNWRTAYSYCRFKHIFTTHMVTPTEMFRIWNDQQTNKAYRCNI